MQAGACRGRRAVATFRPMAATWRWSVRLFAFVAMLFFAALMVVFVIVTVQHFGEKEYVTDNVSGLPPVYVITAILVPCCAAFVGGFWMLFYDSFNAPARSQQPYAATGAPAPAPPLQPAAPTRRERILTWIRERGRPD
jgi:TRAP-type C4-dicarboxylate transport system permease small subunit